LLVNRHSRDAILAAETSPLQLTGWREGKGIYDAVTFYENGRKNRLPVAGRIFLIANTMRSASNNNIFICLKLIEVPRQPNILRTNESYSQYLQQNRQQKIVRGEMVPGRDGYSHPGKS